MTRHLAEEGFMSAKSRFVRWLLPLGAAALALTAYGVQGRVVPTSTAVRTAQADPQQPQAQDAAYQHLIDATNSVVAVKVKALQDARSNETLGQERTGSGVVIGANGLVLTIGYLVLEADSVEVSDADGHSVPASVVAYDHATGFGLVRALAPIAPKPIRIGTAQPVTQLDRLMIVTGGDEQTISVATVVSRRQFAGYWEYMIDGAIFTSPPRLDHSGAALINKDGELVGIGSLFVMDALKPGERLPGNMFVPVDLARPLLDEVQKTGGYRADKRAWLGVNSLEEDGRVKVMQVNAEGPAEQAGIEAGDIILSINGQPVENLQKFYNTLWHDAKPGAEVNLTVLHGPTVKQVTVRSIDRQDFVAHKTGV
jgi:S1-C subfamily serine protease